MNEYTKTECKKRLEQILGDVPGKELREHLRRLILQERQRALEEGYADCKKDIQDFLEFTD